MRRGLKLARSSPAGQSTEPGPSAGGGWPTSTPAAGAAAAALACPCRQRQHVRRKRALTCPPKWASRHMKSRSRAVPASSWLASPCTATWGGAAGQGRGRVGASVEAAGRGVLQGTVEQQASMTRNACMQSTNQAGAAAGRHRKGWGWPAPPSGAGRASRCSSSSEGLPPHLVVLSVQQHYRLQQRRPEQKYGRRA